MNNKGFTLVELLATLVILSIVVGITVASVIGFFNNAKEGTEDVFVGTIKDAMDMYLSSDAKNLSFSTVCSNKVSKIHGEVTVYKTVISFQKVIDSKYKPITQNDLVNPANNDVLCENASNILVHIYRDDDYVYYYSINKEDFNCLNVGGSDLVISNLPEGYVCE